MTGQAGYCHGSASLILMQNLRHPSLFLVSALGFFAVFYTHLADKLTYVRLWEWTVPTSFFFRPGFSTADGRQVQFKCPWTFNVFVAYRFLTTASSLFLMGHIPSFNFGRHAFEGYLHT